VDNQVFKIVLTPALIGAASVAGRRWGPLVSGWLVGLPFTSGPVALFVALEHGESFAAAVAAGTLGGTISQAMFCVVYGRLARRWTWPVAFVASSVAFAVATAGLYALALTAVPLAVAAVGALGAAIRLMPVRTESHAAARALPRWDIPVRMGVATAVVLILTTAAPILGARLTGLLAPFPLYAAILTVFAHQLESPAAAIGVLRGLLLGLFSFAAFFFVLATMLERTGITLAFALAVAVALGLQAGTLALLPIRATAR